MSDLLGWRSLLAALALAWALNAGWVEHKSRVDRAQGISSLIGQQCIDGSILAHEDTKGCITAEIAWQQKLMSGDAQSVEVEIGWRLVAGMVIYVILEAMRWVAVKLLKGTSS